ncbi:Disease resistance protein (TIR-NBS-LRR class) family [Rhynchospora pubera]|uniref:Disease resistance protein (TIR-NBS-LRR class) family n=1 Tax=Rhynchospora pubera TaxID=906938 RepID=A0AAV8DSC7_9POAL|nr:Disease resistance protein (TIR-NBS-LRR class) family [Rhynchospora pubera]
MLMNGVRRKQLIFLITIWNFGGWFRTIIISIELCYVAKSIPTDPRQELTTVMDVLWSCLLYTRLYSRKHKKNTQEDSDRSHCVQLKELMNMWICEGIFSRLSNVEGLHELESEHSNLVIDEEEIMRALTSHSLLYKRNSSTRSHPSSNSDVSYVLSFSGMEEFLSQMKEEIRRYSPYNPPSAVFEFVRSIWYKEWVGESWVSFFHDSYQCSRLKVNPTITALILRGCTDLSKFSLETLFPSLKNLRVIDLSYTSIEILPISLSEMTNLRFLSLKGCNKLRTLTLDSSSTSNSSPLGTLEHLEFLDLGGVSLDTIPDDVGLSKSKLRYLDLSCPTVTSLSSLFFKDISNLRELFFLGCTSLKSLPPSFANLFNLKTFSLSESQVVFLPIETFQHMLKLCDLTLINNRLLRALPELVGHSCLKSFTLSGSPIMHLSLHTCRSLETVCLYDLEELEELDLSATAIKEFPVSILELHRLKRLHLLALPQLRRIPWHKLQHIPEVLNLDRCELVGSRIHLTDSRLFSSFGGKAVQKFVEEGGPLHSFRISISSCNKGNKIKNEEVGFTYMFHHKKPYCYKDIPLIASSFDHQFEQSPYINRHVEISSPERYPTGLEGIFKVTESLSVWDDAFVSCLTDLHYKFPELKKCRLRRCHHMGSIFKPNNEYQGNKLQIIWAIDLQKMTSVLQKGFNDDKFAALKHVHLEKCPRLEGIFPGNLMLSSLETLAILHCGNLRSIFYGHKVGNEDQFPRLHTLQLHELPKLLHLYENQRTRLQMKKWKNLHFRGCWNLQWLPLLVGARSEKVEVDGEMRQCKKLRAGMPEDQISCYYFKSPPPLASFREHVKNKIFLKY